MKKVLFLFVLILSVNFVFAQSNSVSIDSISYEKKVRQSGKVLIKETRFFSDSTQVQLLYKEGSNFESENILQRLINETKEEKKTYKAAVERFQKLLDVTNDRLKKLRALKPDGGTPKK